MLQILKKWFQKGHKKTELEVTILRNGSYYIETPYRIARGKAVLKTGKEKGPLTSLAKMQTNIISSILMNFENPHTYLRLYTYYKSKELLALSKVCQIETIPKEKDTYLYLISECDDPRVWQVSFETWIASHEDMILVSLKYKPENWKETLDLYYRIATKSIYFQPINEYKKELEQCYLLCHRDLDYKALVIDKTYLSENSIFSILEIIARDEGLEFKITRKANKNS